MNGRLLRAVRYFTRDTGIMDGMAAVCGLGGRRAYAYDGREIGKETVYDLASVTKLFTGMVMMRLFEDGRLDLSKRVPYYCPEFRRLGTVTVEQLAGFQRKIETPERIDAQKSREEAIACLREARDAGAPGQRAYSDIPAMILKYVIEAAAGEELYSCVRRMILAPAGMEETWAKVPDKRRGDCLLYGPEYRIEGESRICRRPPARGIPHDPKAALQQGDSGDLCGHAGLFSTPWDLEKMAVALLEGSILRRESLRMLAVNRTGRERKAGGYTQYLGYMCYLKHPDQYYSEIPAAMGPAAFGIGGFTGNHFSVDPQGGRYTLYLGNRIRDRLTVLIPPEGKTRADYGLSEEGQGKIRWTDGRLHFSSVNYVHQKDEHFHRAVEEILNPKGRGRRAENSIETDHPPASPEENGKEGRSG